MTSFDFHHGDCLEGMAQIATATIDLVVTSPPYNLGIAYSRYSDRQDRESYLAWCHEWAKPRSANPETCRIPVSQSWSLTLESVAAA